MAAVSEEMENSEKESDISLETLPEGRPIRRNIYGSVVSSFFLVSERFEWCYVTVFHLRDR